MIARIWDENFSTLELFVSAIDCDWRMLFFWNIFSRIFATLIREKKELSIALDETTAEHFSMWVEEIDTGNEIKKPKSLKRNRFDIE